MAGTKTKVITGSGPHAAKPANILAGAKMGAKKMGKKKK